MLLLAATLPRILTREGFSQINPRDAQTCLHFSHRSFVRRDVFRARNASADANVDRPEAVVASGSGDYAPS